MKLMTKMVIHSVIVLLVDGNTVKIKLLFKLGAPWRVHKDFP